MLRRFTFFVVLLLILGACASKMKEKMNDYREAYGRGDYSKAQSIFNSLGLKKDKKNALLFNIEQGALYLAMGDEDNAITHFQTSLDLIDALYTTKLSSKTASFLINDATDVFYGASYERSYVHYFLSKAYYQRYLKKKQKLDLQAARATILAWDSYFSDVQRSSGAKTIYKTDLMLKLFGGQVHEVSEIANDKQIALQLYKDSLRILESLGGVYGVFNSKSTEYVGAYEKAVKEDKAPSDKLYVKTAAYQDLKNFIHYKILSLTKEIRAGDFATLSKFLGANAETLKKVNEGRGNLVIVLEEGLIPNKVGKTFNFGIKSAVAATGQDSKGVIAKVGVEFITTFAMDKLGMAPTKTADAGNFMFAHSMTKLAVEEAAIEFELPMIENVPLVQRLEVFVLDNKGAIKAHAPLPVVSENGDIARVVLEEDVVARYTKTGMRIATKHITAILAAVGVYMALKGKDDSSGDFLAKTAAMGTYIGSSKGIAALEKADTRQWATLPQALRMMEFKLPPGEYEIALGLYSGNKAPTGGGHALGKVLVEQSGKTIQLFKFNTKI